MAKWTALKHLFRVPDTGTFYDDAMYGDFVGKVFHGSDFFNVGYWSNDTSHPKQACANLMEKLLGFIPDRASNVLDVACGKGATTRHLLRYFEPNDVVAINISSKQLHTSRDNAPGCHFITMDATRLGFRDDYFDNILCVEAAFHFNTRQAFLREACRVLKPGGCLVVSDLLYKKIPPARVEKQLPQENFVKSLAEYKAGYSNAGFSDVIVEDATNECWKAFHRYLWRRTIKGLLTGELREFDFTCTHLLGKLCNADPFDRYVLVSAKKAGRVRSQDRTHV